MNFLKTFRHIGDIIYIQKNKYSSQDQWLTEASGIKASEDLLSLDWNDLCEKYEAYSDRVKHTVEHITGDVLEVGCGIGNITRWIAIKDSVESVTAVESSPVAFAELKRATFDSFHKVIPVLSSMRDYLPLPQKSGFDTVVLSEVIEHVTLNEERSFLNNIKPLIRQKNNCSGCPMTKFVVSTPIGFMRDPFHIRGFSKSAFIHHLEHYYGQIKNIYYGKVQQIAYGYFD